ncbi:nuclear transport factor 2 family protein [Pseudolysinimonas sp.]|uniref:nuclear transport factor 2 family protein n=1 Tax=Pseudolysinimonas sp. TaxID=2680009 RepID=UPI003F814EB2
MPALDPTDLVVAFYTRAFNDGQPEAAAEAALGESYVQHNPGAPDGAAAFIAYVRTMRGQFPQLRLEVKRTITDGEYVWTHSRITLSPERRGLAVADIWRVADNRIVEHWDVIQEVPDQAANGNTMF